MISDVVDEMMSGDKILHFDIGALGTAAYVAGLLNCILESERST